MRPHTAKEKSEVYQEIHSNLPDGYITVREAAKRMNKSERIVSGHCQNGRLHATRFKIRGISQWGIPEPAFRAFNKPKEK